MNILGKTMTLSNQYIKLHKHILKITTHISLQQSFYIDNFLEIYRSTMLTFLQQWQLKFIQVQTQYVYYPYIDEMKKKTDCSPAQWANLLFIQSLHSFPIFWQTRALPHLFYWKETSKSRNISFLAQQTSTECTHQDPNCVWLALIGGSLLYKIYQSAILLSFIALFHHYYYSHNKLSTSDPLYVYMHCKWEQGITQGKI